LEQLIVQVDAQASAMPESLALNQDKWYADKPTITKDNVDFFLRYLEARKMKLDRTWK
jgi:hypothetical protein